MKLTQLTALELARAIRAGEVSPTQATAAAIAAIDGERNNFITLLSQQAMEQAKRLEHCLPDSPLAGVPMGVKDNICTENILTTCASKMLCNFLPPYSATIMERLCGAGSILLGKLNMDEFAMGSTGETGWYGPVKNPWDPTRVAGGSSAGCAGAVAAGECFYALGSDTGGSLRLPAAHCGVTGMKPTYGTVSRYGLVAYAPSLDQIGPIARSAEDCAAVLDIIRGRDAMDSTGIDAPGSLLEGLNADLTGLRVGIPEGWFDDLEEDVARAVRNVAEVLKGRGAQVEFCPMPDCTPAVAAYYVLACGEASSELGRYDGVRYGWRGEGWTDLNDLYVRSRTEGFGWEVKRRILLGTFVLSAGHYEAYYQKALHTRNRIRAELNELLLDYDLLLTPVSAGTAPKLGTSLGEVLEMYRGDRFTVPFDLAGLPSISVPCGFDGKGMPIGAQLVGGAFGDQAVLNAAYAYQQDTDWHRKHPGGGEGA